MYWIQLCGVPEAPLSEKRTPGFGQNYVGEKEMSEKKILKPVALAVGAALAGTFAISGTVNADAIDSPFAMSSLSVGYMVGEGEGSCGGASAEEKEGEGSCGEGSCGGEKEGEGSCGEGHDKEGEGSCGENHHKEGEGSCGEGSCGGDKEGEGSCGEGHDKEDEGSCGGSI
jgi:uncharacterized low-complexity protein